VRGTCVCDSVSCSFNHRGDRITFYWWPSDLFVRNFSDLAITGQYQLALMAGGRPAHWARARSQGDIEVLVCMYMRQRATERVNVVWEPSTLGLAQIDTPPSLAPIPFPNSHPRRPQTWRRERNKPARLPPLAAAFCPRLLYWPTLFILARALSPAVYNQNID
jgi:hypothetical protein